MLRAITYALTQPHTALAAVAALHGNSEPAAVEGLVEVLCRPHAAPLVQAALAALDACEHPLVVDTLVRALDSTLVPVRLAAVEALARHRVTDVSGRLTDVLQTDESWLVRRAALYARATNPKPLLTLVLVAANDPHWRVRHALIQVLRGDATGLQYLE